MNIREAREEDLPTIVNIYNSSIPGRMATADTELISIASKLNWFREHTPNYRPIWVMEQEDYLSGWLSLQSFYGRPAYHKTAEVSLYVAPDYHHQGIGKKLLEFAIEKSPQLGLNTLLAFVFAHNQPSLNLLNRYNFEQWGYLPQVAELDNIERDLIILGRKFSLNN
jgi:phosphinothricin acetyltransferase